MVTNDVIHARWTLVADPDLGWGILGGDATQPDGPAISMVTRLREEPIEDTDDDISLALLSDSVGLEQQYRTMLNDLTAAGTTVVRYGNDDTDALLGAFEPIGLSILGPTKNQLQICATAISGGTTAIDEALTRSSPRVRGGRRTRCDVVGDRPYRPIMNPPATIAETDGADPLVAAASASATSVPRSSQSMVLLTQTSGGKALFGGDMQFADPGVSADGLQEELDALRSEIAKHAPFDFAKLSHHGSSNAFDRSVMEQWAGTRYFGICAGEKSVADRPRPSWICSRARVHHLGAHRPQRSFDVHVRCRRRRGTVSVARGSTNDAKSNATP
jgi:hypothetical protein